MSAVDKAAEVLAAHQFDIGGPGVDPSCNGFGLAMTCDWTHPWDRPLHEMWAMHRAHVAQALADAGLLDDTDWREKAENHAAHAARWERSVFAAESRAEAAERALATLREDVAREIEAGVLSSHPNEGYKDGFRRAADIARGATS